MEGPGSDLMDVVACEPYTLPHQRVNVRGHHLGVGCSAIEANLSAVAQKR